MYVKVVHQELINIPKVNPLEQLEIPSQQLTLQLEGERGMLGIA